MVTDGLPALALEELFATAAELRIATLEFGCGNWSPAPHLDLELLLSAGVRGTISWGGSQRTGSRSPRSTAPATRYSLARGAAHRAVAWKTIRLAGARRTPGRDDVGVSWRPGDQNANWVTTAWPPEAARVLESQWREQVVPYWPGLVAEAGATGVNRLCLELHGQQNVFNVGTLFRLREAVGPVVGANLDPSHLFWTGADPLVAAGALGNAIHHVHAKDTRIDPAITSVQSLIDVTPTERVDARAWSYVTLGDGHGETWWRAFYSALREPGSTSDVDRARGSGVAEQ